MPLEDLSFLACNVFIKLIYFKKKNKSPVISWLIKRKKKSHHCCFNKWWGNLAIPLLSYCFEEFKSRVQNVYRKFTIESGRMERQKNYLKILVWSFSFGNMLDSSSCGYHGHSRQIIVFISVCTSMKYLIWLC